MGFIQSFHHISPACDSFMVTDSHSFYSSGFDLLLVLDKSLTIFPEPAEIHPGQCLFVLPGTAYTLSSHGLSVLLCISFPVKEFLQIFGNPSFLLEPVRVISSPSFSQLTAAYGSFLLTQPPDASPSPDASPLMPLLYKLQELVTASLSKEVKDGLTLKQQSLQTRILEYVNARYQEDISLADTASHLGITPQYLASFFKQALGCTFLQYVNKLRCRMGALYLRHTSLSPETICRFVGLSHPRILLESISGEVPLKQSPPPYHHPPHEVSPKRALQYLEGLSQPAPTGSSLSYERITADAGKSTPFPDFWKRLINLGYATDFSNIQLSNQLIRVQEEIGFTYGRICRLLDLITEYDMNGKTFYDYNRIFRILDVLAEHHMIPFLEISNKLFRIQLSISENVSRNHIKDTTGYFERLLLLLPGFIRACLNRYGQEYVQTWRFEIGYNLYEFMESAEEFPLAKYIRYYQKIAAIIHTYCEGCQIGGPGFNYWKQPEMLLDILNLFSTHQILPDFVTAYVYPVTSDDQTSSLSDNENLTMERIETLGEILRSRYPRMELWITEFNSTMSARNLLNDSSYQAVFLAKNLTGAVDIPVNAMGYYLLSDVPLRYVDTLDLLFGGWGLFSDRGLPKPAYHAYCMFSRLGKHLLKQHKHYLVTAESDSHFRCLFHHYEHIRSKYCRENIQTSHLQSPEALFDARKDYRWEITLEHARPGIYIVKEYTVSESQSNLLAEWKKIRFLTPSRDYDFHALNLLSDITPRIDTLECKKDAPLSFCITLEGHDIKLLIIDLN